MGLISAVKNAVHDKNATAHSTDRTDAPAGAQAASTYSSSGASETYAAQNAPVTKETVHEHRREEITPVIEREREETHVQQVVQPIVDSRQETVHSASAAAPVERAVVEDVGEADARRYQSNKSAHKSYSETRDAGTESVMNAPILNERVHRHNVVEVQPVIEREVQRENVIHTQQPIAERFVAAPKVHDTVVNAPMSIDEFQRSGGNFEGVDLHRV